MGTNYYIKTKKCKTCGHKPDGIHLGKSSGGWKFAFMLNKDYYIDMKTMKRFLKGKKIEDEYNRYVTHRGFWEMVAEKQQITDPEETDAIIIDGYKFYDREFS